MYIITSNGVNYIYLNNLEEACRLAELINGVVYKEERTSHGDPYLSCIYHPKAMELTY